MKVFRDSCKPAALQARAFARGSEIHLGPGQDRYLPHEAWHIVQQAQGRVGPTTVSSGMPINDDPRLEREADVMGDRAATVAKRRDDSCGESQVSFATMNVAQAGGQVGKHVRLAKGRVADGLRSQGGRAIKHEKTPGMWLCETKNANGFHQQIRVGAQYRSARAFSFGIDGHYEPGWPKLSLAKPSPQGQGNGVVYEDDAVPTRMIQFSPMTAKQIESSLSLLESKLGDRGPYDLATQNCVHWSMATFDQVDKSVKNKYDTRKPDSAMSDVASKATFGS